LDELATSGKNCGVCAQAGAKLIAVRTPGQRFTGNGSRQRSGPIGACA
jgi:hypothetical protein